MAVPTQPLPAAVLPTRSLDDLYGLLARRVATWPDSPIVGGQDGLRWRTISSRDFLTRVDGLAQQLATRPADGIRLGDRVILWLPNRWWTPIYFFALWRLGAVPVPFDHEMNADAARRILQLVEPRMIITGFGIEPTWALSGATTEWWEPTPGSIAMPFPDLDRIDHMATIYYTSGTTGNPKGCVITHDNLLYQLQLLPTALSLAPGCRVASILPLSHLFEMTCGMLYPLVSGAVVHYVPSRRGEDIVRVLAEQRITHMVVVPQVLIAMAQAAETRLRAVLPPRAYTTVMAMAARSPFAVRRLLFRSVHARLGGHLQVLASGGAALPIWTQRFWELLGIRVLQGYGASECSPVISFGTIDGTTPYGSVGKPLPETEIRYAASGELLVRGPGVMRGYWRDPERTADVIDADGWYHTGDLVTVDASGNLTISGRAKELLVLPSGMNVWPQDVEDILREQPVVKDAAVVLAPQPGGGATLHAYLIPTGAGAPGDVGPILAEANRHLAQHQRVASASWWQDDDFPRTHTLKVRRSELPAVTVAPRRTVALAASDDDPVAHAVAAVARRPTVDDAETLAALGLDSLALTELTAAIEEQAGVTVADSALRTDMTVGDVRQVVRDIQSGRRSGEQHAVVDEDGRPLARRAEVEANAWAPPAWVYTRGRFLRRLSWPLLLIHRHYVPRVHTVGIEQLRALPNSVIFASTHRSFADVMTFERVLRESPSAWRWNRLVVAASGGILADSGMLGRLVTVGLGLFPLRQYSGRQESLRRLAQTLDAGNSVLLFPQGRHTLPSEEEALFPMARFKPGVAYLSRTLDLPVVPTALAGDEIVIPGRIPPGFRGMVIGGIPIAPRRHDVAVAFGSPMWPLPNETNDDFTERLEEVSFSLARQAQALIDAEP